MLNSEAIVFIHEFQLRNQSRLSKEDNKACNLIKTLLEEEAKRELNESSNPF